jgi:hypothetical protein
VIFGLLESGGVFREFSASEKLLKINFFSRHGNDFSHRVRDFFEKVIFSVVEFKDPGLSLNNLDDPGSTP